MTNKLDIVGVLRTAADKITLCKNKETIIKIIKDLKKDLNIKEIRQELIDYDY